MKHLHRMSLVIFVVQFAPFEDLTATLKSSSSLIIKVWLRVQSVMKVTFYSSPLHEEAAAESRNLVFRSMKCPRDRLVSQLCFKACRSSLLSP